MSGTSSNRENKTLESKGDTETSSKSGSDNYYRRRAERKSRRAPKKSIGLSVKKETRSSWEE